MSREIDALDLNLWLKVLVANRFKFAAFAFLGLISGFLFNLTQKPLWIGEFDIVVSKDVEPDRGSQFFLRLTGLTGSSSIGTDIIILRSPLVLRPAYHLATSIESSNNKNATSFRSWISKLDLSTVDDSNVIRVQYSSSFKSAVLPVLQKISELYKLYSTQERTQKLAQRLSYTKDQISRLKEKSDNSFRLRDEFSLKYGITGSSSNSTNFIGTGSPVGASLDTPSSGFTGLSADSRPSTNSSHLARLSEINKELIRRKQLFTSSDPSIIRLERERAALKQFNDATIGGSFAFPSPQIPSKSEAQDLLIQFRSLDRQSQRDASALASLESNLVQLKLENARVSDSWQVISEPSLQPTPTKIRLSLSLFVGLFSGIGLGSLYLLLSNKFHPVIHSKSAIAYLLSCETFDPLVINGQVDMNSTLNSVIELLPPSQDSVALLHQFCSSSAIKPEKILNEQSILSSRLVSINSLANASSFNHIIITADPSAVDPVKLEELRRFRLLNSKISLSIVWTK